MSLYRFCLLLLGLSLVAAQSNEDGYIGYNLVQRGDPLDVTYDTASTSANVSLTVPEPDVFLNATVSVGEISIEVQNLTAKINLDAQVLNLLDFNAGVVASVDRVSLLIQNVSARVTLEARLGKIVEMVNNILDSVDLNPIIAELGSGLGEVIGDVGDVISGDGEDSETAAITKRSFELEKNILYSVNDYQGNTHTNRILAQNGDIVDRSLDNSGNTYNERIVGNYKTDMKFNGYNESDTIDGQEVRELEYTYEPFPGLYAVSLIMVTAEESVVATRLIAEAQGGGSSTILGED